MPRKERVSSLLCGVALLLSPASGNALDVDAKSFRCITKMTPVRQFYVDNLQGLRVRDDGRYCPCASLQRPRRAGASTVVCEGLRRPNPPSRGRMAGAVDLLIRSPSPI